MLYHASSVKDLKVLKPHISSHGKSWVYFSSKKESPLPTGIAVNLHIIILSSANTFSYLKNPVLASRWI